MRHRHEKELGMMFKVPNTEEGRVFLNTLGSYAAGGTRILVRSRGPRAVHAKADNLYRGAYRQAMPKKHATWFAVYISKPTLDAEWTRVKRSALNELNSQVITLSRSLNGANLAAAQNIQTSIHRAQFPVKARRAIQLERKPS